MMSRSRAEISDRGFLDLEISSGTPWRRGDMFKLLDFSAMKFLSLRVMISPPCSSNTVGMKSCWV